MKLTRSLLASLALATPVFAEVQPLAHYNLQGQGGIRDIAAPAELSGQVNGAPTLARQGSPKIMSNSPEPRRQVSDSSIKFENGDQCYSAGKNLANGDRFVVEVWAYATKGNDAGLHAVLANGNSASGFLIASNEIQVYHLILDPPEGTCHGECRRQCAGGDKVRSSPCSAEQLGIADFTKTHGPLGPRHFNDRITAESSRSSSHA